MTIKKPKNFSKPKLLPDDIILPDQDIRKESEQPSFKEALEVILSRKTPINKLSSPEKMKGKEEIK